MSRAISWILAALAMICCCTLSFNEIQVMVNGPEPEETIEAVDQADLSELLEGEKVSEGSEGSEEPEKLENPFEPSPESTELQRRYLVEQLAKKLKLPMSTIAIGSAVGGSDAHIRITCDPSKQKEIDDCVDDLQYPLRLLKIKDITLQAPGGKLIEVNTVAPDTLGYALSRDMVMMEKVRSVNGWLADAIARSAITHLDKCIGKNPLDPALVAYRLVFEKELGNAFDPAGLATIEANAAEADPDAAAMATQLSAMSSCTASGGDGKLSADQMAQYIREHFYPDVMQNYLVKDVYTWANMPDKAQDALKENPHQRYEVDHSLMMDAITMALTVCMLIVFLLQKERFDELPDLPNSIACPEPYGWWKPFLIVAFTTIIVVLGLVMAMAIAPDQIQEASSLLVAYFDPMRTAITCDIEELILVLPAIFAAVVLVGRKMKLTDFLKLHLKTDRYSTGQLVKFGFECFVLTFTPAMVATLLTYGYHYPWEKPGPAATELLTASGNIPAILLLFFGYAILAPLFEEIAFRGILHPFLRRQFAVWPSIIIGSAIFALVHMEFTPWWLMDKFIFAAINAYALEKTGSITPGIISHMLTNTFVIVFMLASLT